MTVCTGWIYFMPRLTISVTAKEATSSGYCINLIDKYDTRRIFLGILKQISHS